MFHQVSPFLSHFSTSSGGNSCPVFFQLSSSWGGSLGKPLPIFVFRTSPHTLSPCSGKVSPHDCHRFAHLLTLGADYLGNPLQMVILCTLGKPYPRSNSRMYIKQINLKKAPLSIDLESYERTSFQTNCTK